MPLKISIITAVFNREYAVATAVQSIVSQSHENIEHIVIDGASTDGTLDAISRHSDRRTAIYSEPDKGIYYALNKGISIATGDVIGFMHSDDFYADSDVLARVALAFDDPEINAVYGDLVYVDQGDTSKVVRFWRAGTFSSNRLKWGWMPPHPTLFVRRSVVERLGGFNTNFQIAADYDQVLRYFHQGKIRSKYIPHVLVKMRLGGVSNQSLKKILRKSYEDYRAMKINRIGGIGALIWKNLSKLKQF